MEKKNKNSFEQNLRRLQEISDMLEDENLGLEAAITLYEEGVGLSKICLEELKKAELRISQIKIKAGTIINEGEEPNNDGEIFK